VTVDRFRLSSLAAALALAALPSAAAAAPYVPPGNSAANQYTEAVPTAGGPKATGKGKQGGDRSPGRVLGARNAAKLDAKGPQGRATAELAAATAPPEVAAAGSAPVATSQPGGSGDAGGQGSPGNVPTGGGSPDHTAPGTGKPQAQIPAGSSGLGEAIGQATGSSSSGRLGLLLPLLILAVATWAVAYVLRQRRGHPAA
jgi:hypothetical protein